MRFFSRIPLFLALLAILLPPVTGVAREIRQVDIADVANALLSELDESRQESSRRLSRIDPAIEDAIQRMQQIDGFQYSGFSARTQVETLYKLAEASEEGEGRRFLAKVFRDLKQNSAALASDPYLIEVSAGIPEAELSRTLRFANPVDLAIEDARKPLPDNVARAVDLIADASDGKHRFHSVVQSSRRHLNLGKPPKDRAAVRDAILKSTTSRGVIAHLFQVHAPPPSVERAAQAMLVEIASKSAAFELDPRFPEILKEVSEAPISEKQQRISELEAQLESRKAQASVLSSSGFDATGAPGSVLDSILSALIEGGIEGLERAFMPDPSNRSNDYRKAKANHSNYSQRSLAPRATNSSRPRGPSANAQSPVPRSYRVAIRSPRAARGVAVGADVHMPSYEPSGAIWIEAAENPNFGRLAVVSRASFLGSKKVYVSRPLFADSAAAAISTLWGKHGSEAEFRDGEITILMSMDPDPGSQDKKYSTLITKFQNEALDKVRQYYEQWPAEAMFLQSLLVGDEERANMISTVSQLSSIRLARISRELELLRAQIIPNGIVVHPAATGFQLAWAAARVDFWFGNLEKAFEEVEKLQTVSRQDRDLVDLFSGTAGTWQFYERESEISLVEPVRGSDWGTISVRSATTENSEQYVSPSHFSVTLFAVGSVPSSVLATRVEDGIWRLEEEETAVNPLLDWLFLNHPDFIRLNDYSEALSILRWLKEAEVGLDLLDALGVPFNTPPPNWIYMDDKGLQVDLLE